MKAYLYVVFLSLSIPAFALHDKNEITHLSQCNSHKNWEVNMNCFKAQYDKKVDVMNELISDIRIGLNNSEVVKNLPVKQHAWEVKVNELCKVDVLKNTSWKKNKDYLDKIDFYACKHGKILERIKELGDYPYINITCLGNYTPSQKPTQKACSYFNDFDAYNNPWLCPHDAPSCLCGEQANINTYLPKGMNIAASCGLKKIEGGYIQGFLYLTGEHIVKGTIKRNEWVAGDRIIFNVNKAKPKWNNNYIFQASDFLYFRFADHKIAMKKFRTPELTEKDGCFKADATIKIKNIAITGGDSDESGTWVLDYEILDVGNYTSCPSED